MAAGSTYTPIQSTTLSSDTATYTFSSIPSTYTDLVLIINGGITSAGDIFIARFNGDSGTNYSDTYLLGNGTTASSGRASNQSYVAVMGRGAGVDNTLNNNAITNIQNYSNSTTYKTTVSRFNLNGAGGNSGTVGYVGLWRNTSAITSIAISTSAGNLKAGSTFTLYGIQAA